jgi:hypothetical protein
MDPDPQREWLAGLLVVRLPQGAKCGDQRQAGMDGPARVLFMRLGPAKIPQEARPTILRD